VTADIRVIRAGTLCKAEGVRLMQDLIDKADDEGLVLAAWVEAFKRDAQGPEWDAAWDCLSNNGFIEMVGADVRALPPSP
jgi:hypothetical protein